MIKIIKIISSIILSAGVALTISPFLLYKWINGNYNRYLWIINGPAPYNNFGSSAYQLRMYLGLFLIGICLIIISIILGRLRKK